MTAPLEVLSEGTVLVHVGPYKTGSSAIQVALHRNRAAMRELGVAYPGKNTRPREAGWALLGTHIRGRRPTRPQAWDRFARRVRTVDALRVCVSNEDFGRAGAPYVRRIVEELGGDRVHVIAVARRYDRLLPSQWQERVKNFASLTYDDYVRSVLDGPDSERHDARAFWNSHGPDAVGRWVDEVGPDRFTLVVHSDRDKALLSRTFEQLLGLPQDMLAAHPAANLSLSASGTELLRRVNAAFEAHGWSDVAYDRLVRGGVIPGLRAGQHGPLATPIGGLPGWSVPAVSELSARHVERLRGLGVRVVGDLDSLRVPADATPGSYQPEVVSMDTAEEVVVATLRRAIAVVEQQTAGWDALVDPSTPEPEPAVSVEDTGTRDLAREVARRVVRRARGG